MSEEQYPDNFVAGLEWIWGEGFLSPGGPDEVRELLKGVSLHGKTVLDIGCGLGAIDLMLVSEFGAASVVAIDVEEKLLVRAAQIIEEAGMSERIRLQLVEPGPLPFPDESFDVVFSKDAIIHIPDKKTLYEDVYRVLAAGGLFVASDWLYGGMAVPSDEMKFWLEIVHLNFNLLSPENCRELLENTEFENVEVRNRNAWYRQEVINEIAAVTGENRKGLEDKVGEEVSRHRLESSRAKQKVLESGELCPCHMHALKPTGTPVSGKDV